MTQQHYVRYHLRLTDKDAAKLDAAVKSSGLSRASYMRALINDLIPLDKPSPDYFKMMRELHAIGNNVNQIAHLAHATGNIDTAYFEQCNHELSRATIEIVKAAYLHRKLER